MEASVIFVLARLWGLRVGGAAVVLDNMLDVSAEDGEFDPDIQLEHSAESIERLALFGSSWSALWPSTTSAQCESRGRRAAARARTANNATMST
jgi:hypothetical protein